MGEERTDTTTGKHSVMASKQPVSGHTACFQPEWQVRMWLTCSGCRRLFHADHHPPNHPTTTSSPPLRTDQVAFSRTTGLAW